MFASAQQNGLGIKETDVCQKMAGAPGPVAHSSSVNAGESGCSDYSPSVLINFTPSSMLIIDNLVGSRPSFLTATCKLLPAAQQLAPSPSKKKKKKKAYFSFTSNEASDGANTLVC